jgi:hypothetical protein
MQLKQVKKVYKKMTRKKVVAILRAMFILALVSSLALARSSVPGPVLYFDPLETNQTDKDKVWRNAGLAGGEIEP